jgi:large subunit ribosomal protein L9
MKVILLKDVSKLGGRYEVKEVSSGYASNFLIPKGLVKVATSGEMKRMEKLKEDGKQKREEEKNVLKEQLKKLEAEKVELLYPANDKGHLFKGVQKEDIVEALGKKGVNIKPDYIELEKPIKEIGDYDIKIKVPDLKSKVGIAVKAVQS